MKVKSFEDLILFENSNYLVINKPPGFSTLADRQAHGKQNVIALAKEYWEDAQVAHRLDKDTSGALAIAKNPEAYRHLSLQFQHRKVEKIYHAFVQGTHNFQQKKVDLPILPLNAGVVKIDKQGGKPAQTYFDSLQLYQGYSLIACRPITGRMHQIRIHLAVLKASIIHDEQYGGKPLYLSQIKRKFNLKKDHEEQPLIQRVALHAFRLSFADLDDKMIKVEAPYPKDLRALQNQLERHAL